MSLEDATIIQAALDLLRENGLEGLSVRKLTSRLGVQAPSIYWRYANKEALLDAAAEAILQEGIGEIGLPSSPETWQDWLTHLMQRLRAAMLAYPDGARVIAGAHIPNTPTLGQISETALTVLQQEGLDLITAAIVVFTAIDYTFGHVIEEQDSPSSVVLGHNAQDAFAKQYPMLSQAIRLAQETRITPADAYDAGLRLIIR